MANDVRPNQPNANPFGEYSLHDHKAENVADSIANPHAFLARYVRYYDKLRAEGVQVGTAMKLVRGVVEREQAHHFF